VVMHAVEEVQLALLFVTLLANQASRMLILLQITQK
jgi:hypothetical protein